MHGAGYPKDLPHRNMAYHVDTIRYHLTKTAVLEYHGVELLHHMSKSAQTFANSWWHGSFVLA